MKLKLTLKQQSIWSENYGADKTGREVGLASNRVENITNMLVRDSSLTPRMLWVHDRVPGLAGWHPWTRAKFNEVIRAVKTHGPAFPKGHFDNTYMTFYLPKDCEIAIGSSASNWVAWANCIFKFGRQSHLEAPKLNLSPEMLAEVQALGVSPNTNQQVRLLSLNMVVFYLAAQTKTWTNPSCIIRAKKLIAEQFLTVLDADIIPEGEPVNLDALFDGPAPEAKRNPVNAPISGVASDEVGETPAPKSRIPKNGQNLHGYNPEAAVAAGPTNGTATIAPAPTITVTVAPPESLAERVIRLKRELADTEAAMKVEAREKMLQQYLKATITEVELREGTEFPTRLVLRTPDGATRVLLIQ